MNALGDVKTRSLQAGLKYKIQTTAEIRHHFVFHCVLQNTIITGLQRRARLRVGWPLRSMCILIKPSKTIFRFVLGFWVAF